MRLLFPPVAPNLVAACLLPALAGAGALGAARFPRPLPRELTGPGAGGRSPRWRRAAGHPGAQPAVSACGVPCYHSHANWPVRRPPGGKWGSQTTPHLKGTRVPPTCPIWGDLSKVDKVHILGESS